MATQEEKVFNWFIVCTGIFVGTIVSIVIFGNFVAPHQDAQAEEMLAERLSSMTVVAIEGEPEPVVETVVVPQETVMQASIAADQLYNSVCSICHSMGLAGAPSLTDPSWSSRLEQGIDVIEGHVLNGYQGSAGVMPAKGGRTDLSDEEILAALDYMLEQI